MWNLSSDTASQKFNITVKTDATAWGPPRAAVVVKKRISSRFFLSGPPEPRTCRGCEQPYGERDDQCRQGNDVLPAVIIVIRAVVREMLLSRRLKFIIFIFVQLTIFVFTS
jgi:hypothetical protein